MTDNKSKAIDSIINKKLKGNGLKNTIENGYPEFKQKIFTDDMLVVTSKIEEYQKREDWNMPVFRQMLDAFIVKNLNNVKYESGVARRYFIFNQNTLPVMLTTSEDVIAAPKSELIIKEEAKSNNSDKIIKKTFIFKKENKEGEYLPAVIETEKLEKAVEFVRINIEKKMLQKQKSEILSETIPENNATTNMSDILPLTLPPKDKPNTKSIKATKFSEDIYVEDENFLVVPFNERDEAEKAGAKYTYQYGKERRLYYAPKGTSVEEMKKWNRELHEQTVLSFYGDVLKVGSSGRPPEVEFLEIIDSLGLELINGLEYSSSGNNRAEGVKLLRKKGGESKDRSKRPGSYKLSIDAMGFHYGWAQDNSGSVPNKITYNQRSSSGVIQANKEIKHIENQIYLIKSIISDREAKKAREVAIKKCQEEYAEARPMTSPSQSEYMVNKKMDLYPHIKIKGNLLVIPFYKLTSPTTLATNQKIGKIKNKETGELFMHKWNAVGAEKKGVYTILSQDEKVTVAKMDVVYMVEGVSTGASVNKATGLPIVVALDAGNMAEVARETRRLYPEKKIVVLCDNDHHKVLAGERDPSLPMNKKENSGLKAARIIEKESGGFFVLPRLSAEDMAEKMSDWNDIHIKYGLGEVRKQIATGLSTLGIKHGIGVESETTKQTNGNTKHP